MSVRARYDGSRPNNETRSYRRDGVAAISTLAPRLTIRDGIAN